MGLLSSLMGNAGMVDPEKLKADYSKLLTDKEDIEIGFRLIRDTFIFTNKRLLLIDKQGLSGRKTEYFSVVYGSISRFSIETAGTFDLDAELKIWISGESSPSIQKKFNKSVDVYEVQQLLASHVLK
ncbi:PH domain-containing protein [Marinilabilia rubra]|uniref:Helicase n=1 Tax=Marinilabilia rubra TaxID=2162893 RepID=A0A2U2BD39_9BACT|nr:PH domain-containing protein [Marinilabilia rubra]PWE00984.1 helicase [Marinilabilia rubra]